MNQEKRSDTMEKRSAGRRGRDVSGFQEIYETYSRPVYRFLLALTRNETLAEDLLQDVFYQALLHID